MARKKKPLYRPDIKPGLIGTYIPTDRFLDSNMDTKATVLACYIDGVEVPSFPYATEDTPVGKVVKWVEVDLELSDGTLVDKVPYPRNRRDDDSKSYFCKPVIDSIRFY